MPNAEELRPAPFELVKLNVVLPASVTLQRVPAAFSPDAEWLGERLVEKTLGTQRFACDLELRVEPDRRVTFRKSAIVGLGAPVRDDDGWVVPVEWRAASFAPLFPVFVGHLRLGKERLELDGTYAPPAGKIGYALDRALFHIAARGTGRWFLEKVESILKGV
jgi:hypothetical protein